MQFVLPFPCALALVIAIFATGGVNVVCGQHVQESLLESPAKEDAFTGELSQGDRPQGHLSSSTPKRSQIEPWESKLLLQFEKGLFRHLTDSEQGCLDCHSSESTSNLVLSGRPLEDLRRLLDGEYLSSTGPDSFIGRILATNPDRRMPKDAPPWDKKQIRQLRKLIKQVSTSVGETGVAFDERFPRSLLAEFHSAPKDVDTPSQLLTYRQLKSKIRVIFDDDWVRGDQDNFQEHLAAFGGADFKTRFNESRTATAAYLSSLESLARDVSKAAFRNRTGPFSELDEVLCSNPPTESDSQGALSSDVLGVQRLYERVLFRAPSDSELKEAQTFLSRIRALGSSITGRDSELEFQVTAEDPVTGHTASQNIRMHVSGHTQQLQQVLVDQSQDTFELSDAETSVLRLARPWWLNFAEPVFSEESSTGFFKSRLGTISLEKGQAGEIVLHNAGTLRTVTFAGIEVSRNGQTRSIQVNDPLVEVEGAWSTERKDGVSYLADGNQHKGASTIRVSVLPEDTLQLGETADYELVLRFRAQDDFANNVLVELRGPARQDRIVAPRVIEDQELGIATFAYHCGDDTRPFIELPGQFQFDEDSFVKISNEGTFKRVTAAAVDFVDAANPEKSFLVDSKIAEGMNDWEAYNEGNFRAYNVRGMKLHDGNKKKGELALKYLLRDRKDHGWLHDNYYKIRIYYPGKRDHEPRVPVEVHARRSSPILRVQFPSRVRSDANVRLDASSSFTVQGSELRFRWRQISGPTVEGLKDLNSPSLEFKAPRLSVDEVAWASLCAALVRHPDFLFTRPPSLDDATAGHPRKKLQLVRLAQDLLGRPPTTEEFAKLGNGFTLESLVDEYLQSEEFKDYYFHRVRLYLESQGTTVQDEPARLWTYIATNDLPFQEILTADYTVDEHWEKRSRPAHHGRTGVLTTKGFIDGKPGLPHYNYAAQVSMLFLGYVYEVPPEIVEQREGVTALGTTDPNSNCYSCHKILTPLAFQRLNWTDAGEYRTQDESGLEIDASDRDAVDEYPFKGEGLEAFAMQAAKKERFVRTMLNTHVNFYFGRPMRLLEDERDLYKRLWDEAHASGFKIRPMIRSIVMSPEYWGIPESVEGPKP
ncbi:MAG: hypothetical protein ACE361_21440 [Aureliella sp.]